MNFKASVLWSLKILALLCLLVPGTFAAPAEKAAEKPNPVIGKWRWTDNQIVECKADHTFVVSPTKRTGTWKLDPSETVERKYVFTWDQGLFVDSLMMAGDESNLKGKNQQGKKIAATKVK